MKTTTGYFACAVLALCGAAFTPACSSAVEEGTSEGKVASEESELSGVHDAGDLSILGSLDGAAATATFTYSNPGLYRSYKFGGAPGDQIDAVVTSTSGRADVWVLDNGFKTLAHDVASSSQAGAHVAFTVKPKESFTHYLVVRELKKAKTTFTVSYTNRSAILACKSDADCTVVAKHCCTNLGNTAVAKGEEQAYRDSLECPAHLMCPMIATLDDHGVAECNGTTKTCEYVLPADIRCGGFMTPPFQHTCPTGYDCLVNRISDIPGTCVERCGGITGKGCSSFDDVCVDDPRDTCDPANGGADCGGICQPKPACVTTKLCLRTSHFDPTVCDCVPNPVCGGTEQIHCDATQYSACIDDPNGNCHLGGGDASCTGVCAK